MQHIPVLQKEIVHTFSYLGNRGGFFVDGTLGEAGHSLALANKARSVQFIGIDKDQTALDLARKNIVKNGLENRFNFINDDFKNIGNILSELHINKIDGAMLDLGVSSMQLDQKERGFSFQDSSVDLDMRMDQKQTFSAKDVVNGYSKNELEQILNDFGEEKFSRKIAENIVEKRKNMPIKSVGDLIDIIEESVPEKFKHQKIHFATRTFQAIRIEVNKELEGLRDTIEKYVQFLEPGAKLAVISFHSLEDRIIKQAFAELANPCKCPKEMPCVCSKKPIIKIETKKPIIASEEETSQNPRSRSAKLRIATKLS